VFSRHLAAKIYCFGSAQSHSNEFVSAYQLGLFGSNRRQGSSSFVGLLSLAFFKPTIGLMKLARRLCLIGNYRLSQKTFFRRLRCPLLRVLTGSCFGNSRFKVIGLDMAYSIALGTRT